MHVAVIIPAFNIAGFLPTAIQSVLEQTFSDWSLVIVDDGSTDTTAAVGARFQDKRIRLLRQSNSGVSAARNAGIAAVLAGSPSVVVPRDALMFLDGDDWLAPAALGLLAETLENASWAAAAVGRYARVDSNAVARLSPAPARGRLLERLLTRNLFANGGHLLIRREAIEGAGNFRTDLVYGEDWEYWTRLAAQGEFGICPIPFSFAIRTGTSCRCLLVQGDRPWRLSPRAECDLRQPWPRRALGDGPSGGPGAAGGSGDGVDDRT
jgi:glycosyltransferase involved in cell wall biosynthesis